MARKKNSSRNIQRKSREPSKGIPSELLEEIPDETKEAYIQARSFRGPLPPPSLFGQYEEILPGSADRMLTLAENEQSHRHKWESDVLTAQKADVRRGQWMGFGIGISALVVACIVA